MPLIKRHISKNTLQATLALSALAVACAGHAQGQVNAEAAEGAASWGLGLGVGMEGKAYRGVGNDTNALPLVMFENRWVSVFGPGVDLKLPSAGPVSLRLRARYADDGFEADDSPALAGMAERKAAI
jgi:outer membrane protein